MSYVEKTEEYKGYTISIEQDEPGESPREWDNAGTIVTWHRRYTLGDEQPTQDPEEWLESMAKIDTEVGNYEFSKEDCIRMIEEQGHVILPVYMYDHSGITISTSPFSCSWDSGQAGWIYMEKDKIQEEFSGDKERAIKCLQGEIETYDMYLTGDVWGYRIKDEDGDDTIHSCWGFYGDDGVEDAISQAKGEIDWEVSKQKEYEGMC